jgi:hypothetical protein
LKYLQEANADTTKNRISRFITDEFFQLSAVPWIASQRRLTMDLELSTQAQKTRVQEMTRR